MYKDVEEMLILIRNKEIAMTETDLAELAWSLLQENKRLEKSNRNWRRKCQRLRSKELKKNEANKGNSKKERDSLQELCN